MSLKKKLLEKMKMKLNNLFADLRSFKIGKELLNIAFDGSIL